MTQHQPHCIGPQLQALVETLRSTPPTSCAEARDLLRRAELPDAELAALADFGHCPGDGYGRRCVAADDHFELMIMSWCPGDASAIHDHGQSEVGAVQVFGAAEHATFTIGAQVTTHSVEAVEPGTILDVPPELVHQMSNPTDRPFLSLHLYARRSGRGPVTQDARIFDLLNQRVLRTDGGVFFALAPELISSVEAGVSADAATLQRQNRLLAQRLERIEAAQLFRPDLTQTTERLRHWQQEFAA